MWKAKSYTVRPESYYTGIYDSTTDTGESSPIWSVRFMEHRPPSAIEIIEGVATVLALTRTSTIHTYTLEAETKTRLLENTLFFPGWRVYVDGNETPVEFQDPSYRGLMTFWVEPGNHDIRIEFTQTKLRRVAEAISLTGLFVFLITITIGAWQSKRTLRSR